MSEYAQNINLYVDTKDVVSQIAKTNDGLLILKKTAYDTSAALSNAFVPVLTHMKNIQEQIAKTITSTAKLKDTISQISLATKATEQKSNPFEGIQKGIQSVTGVLDGMDKMEKYNGKLYNLFVDPLTAPDAGSWLKSAFPKTADLADAVGDWAKNSLYPSVSGIFSAGGTIVGGSASAMLASVTTAFSNMAGAFKSAFSGIGSALSGMSLGWGAAIAGIITLIVLLVTNWDTVKAAILTAWEAIKNALGAAAEWLNTTVIQPIVGFFTGLWNGIVSIFSTAAQWVYDVVLKPIIDFFTPIAEWFSQLFGSIWQTVVDIFSNIVAFIIGYFELVFAIWSTVGMWFYEHVIQPVAEFFVGLWNSISTWAVNTWNNIVAVFIGVATWFNENVIQPVAKFFAGLWEGFSNAAKHAWEGVKSVFSKVAAFFKDIFGKAWAGVVSVFSAAGEIFTNIKDGILSVFKKIVNGIITGINNVVAIPFNGINLAIENIKDINILGLTPFDGLKLINVPQIPYLAQGAVLPANKPFMAVVGDQKSGTNVEAPLDTIKQALAEVLAMQGGGDVVINFTGDLAQLARVLKPAIDRENRRVGGSLARGVL